MKGQGSAAQWQDSRTGNSVYCRAQCVVAIVFWWEKLYGAAFLPDEGRIIGLSRSIKVGRN
jgi:hypothetical protein